MQPVLSGFADEAGIDLATQIRATRELGWSHIEMRNIRVSGFPAGNLHDIPEEAFLQLVDILGESNIKVHCFGSAIANGGKSIEKPFDTCRGEAERAAQRMPKLGTQFIRIMSYPVLGDGHVDQQEEERFCRLREIQAIFNGAGVTVVHENCGNYGGMGWTYSLKLLENVPGLKLVFDMGNCVFDLDYSQPAPHPLQSAWDFYSHVRDHIAHIHIKDLALGPDEKPLHVYPGEGLADVQKILCDLSATGYNGALSIEPHMGIGPEFRDFPPDEARYLTYVEYGRRLSALL